MSTRAGRVAAFVLAAAAFFGAAVMERTVRATRPALRSGVASGGETLPPTVQLLSTLLGSFRSLLVDFLWIRAEALQGEGRYFAAAELARWITALQPRVEGSWSFQAWNLGVNVPSVLPDEDRWPYVRSALELLWQDGLGANPGSLGLYREIGWFWQNRIGGELDPAGSIYRRKVRERVEEILGPKPWDLEAFARAERLMPLLRKEASVAAFLATLGRAGVARAEETWLELWREPERFLGDQAGALRKALQEDPLLAAYDRGLRAAAWRQSFGVDMNTVAGAVRRYGDIEVWSPDSFVVFWTCRGLGKLRPGTVRLDGLSLWRMQFSSLRRLFRGGKLHLAARIDQDYQDLIGTVEGDPVHRNQRDLFAEDRRDFLKLAVPVLYLNGWRRSAERLFAAYRALAPDAAGDLSCEDFTFRALFTDFVPQQATRQELLTVLKGLLRQSVWAWSRGEEEGARSYLAFARDLHYAVNKVFGGDLVPAFEAVVGEVRSEERNRARRQRMTRRAGKG